MQKENRPQRHGGGRTGLWLLLLVVVPLTAALIGIWLSNARMSSIEVDPSAWLMAELHGEHGVADRLPSERVFAPARYFRHRAGMVHLSGTVHVIPGPGVTEVPLFTLAEDHRPEHPVRGVATMGDGGFTRVEVRPDGQVAWIDPMGETSLFLDGIAFRADH